MPYFRNATAATHKLALLSVLALTTVLSACGGGAGSSDNLAPQVHITSGAVSPGADYELSGLVFDNSGIEELSYTLRSGEPQPLLHADGSFSVLLSLNPGANMITVSAADAAGNTGSDTVSVVYNAAPGEATASQDIAARGDTITISGTNFGSTGTVQFGDVDVSAASWSDTEISVEVPADAPGGPQIVTVNSPYGSSSFELFIGVDFASGTLEDLAALGLPPGSAVRLGAGTFRQTSPQLLLDNLSLYGQGQADTIINTGAGPIMLILAADPAEDIVMADLTLQTDFTLVGPNPPEAIGTLSAVEAEPGSVRPDAALIGAAIIRAAGNQLGRQAELLSLNSSAGSFTIRDVRIEQAGGGLGLATMRVDTSPLIYPGAVNISNVEFDASSNSLMLVANGNVSVNDSRFRGGRLAVMSLGGAVDITASRLSETARSGSAAVGFGIFYHSGLTMTDSEFLSASPDYVVAPLSYLTGSSPMFTYPAQLEIAGNSFSITDPNPVAGTTAGTLTIVGSRGTSHIHDNSISAHRLVQLGTFGGNLLIEGNDLTVGSSGIVTSPLELRSTPLESVIEFRNNDVRWLNGGGLHLVGQFGYLVEGNTLAGQSGTALTLLQEAADYGLNVIASDNTFRDFTAALDITLAGVLANASELTFSGNDFNFPVDAAGKVATLLDVVNASIDADGNRWGGETDLTVLNGFIDRSGSTPSDMLELTSVLP